MFFATKTSAILLGALCVLTRINCDQRDNQMFTSSTRTIVHPTDRIDKDANGIFEVGEPNWPLFIKEYPVKLVGLVVWLNRGFLLCTDEALTYHTTFYKVYFHIPWCAHCKTFAPIYDSLVARVQALVPGIAVAKVDTAQWRSLRDRYNIERVPSIRLLWKDKNVEYPGNREPEDFLLWIADTLQPDNIVVHRDILTHWGYPEYDVVVVGLGAAVVLLLLCCCCMKCCCKRKDKTN